MEKKKSISPAALNQLLATGKKVAVIDVRSKEEYDLQHLPFAHNFPLEEIEPGKFSPGGNNIVVFVCTSGGGRSERAAHYLKANSSIEAYSLSGGTIAWFETNHLTSHE